MSLKDLRIVIADDHEFLLNGLNDHLLFNGLNVIGKASDGSQALQLITDLEPDLAILDVDMPYLSGLTVAEIAKAKGFSTRIVVLSLYKEAAFVREAKMLGIMGYVLKGDSTDEIIQCITAVSQGQQYFSKSLQEDHDRMPKSISNLTPSERKILRLIARKMNSKEISEQLFVSERTIEKHRSNIVSKLKLNGHPNSLTNWAIENKSIINNL